MADLPDLDTSQVGYIGYWNALDQGGIASENFDPEDVLSAPYIENTTVYDNGVTGEVDAHKTEDDLYEITDRPVWKAKVRVKTDGWFVAYMDRTNNYQTLVDEADTVDNVYGYWNIHTAWDRFNRPPALTQHSLSRAINHLTQGLTTSPTWNYSDVGVYNYEYPNVTNTTGFSGVGGDGLEQEFIVADGTNLHYAAVTGVRDTTVDNNNIEWNGNVLTNSTRQIGTYNALSEINTGVAYTHTANDTKGSGIITATLIWD